MKEYKRCRFHDNKLFYEKKDLGISVEQGGPHNLWRINFEDGSRSDYSYNETRAKDNAKKFYISYENTRESQTGASPIDYSIPSATLVA